LPYDIDGDGLGNFSAWKNAVLDEATGDWTLCIDCDEQLFNGRVLRRYLDTPSLNAYAMQQINVSIGLPETINTPHRLIRNHKGYKYRGCIHEHPHTDAPGYEFIEPFLIITDVTIPHDGYLMEDRRYNKAAIRNLPMLRKDRALFPDRVYGRLLEMRDVLNIARWARNKLGTFRPEDVKAMRDLILVYEQYFCTPGTLFYADANKYYQDALALLSLVDVVPYGQRHVALHAQIQVVAAMGPLTPQALQQSPPLQRWFKDVEEIEAYILAQTAIMKKAMGPLAVKLPERRPTEVAESLLHNVTVP